MDMLDWSPDFCLSCDRQSVSGEAYCSQQCRLADVEKASGSSSSTSSPQTMPTTFSSAPPSGNGFYLPPPLNFSAMTSRQSPSSRSPVTIAPPSYGYPTQASQQGRASSLYSSPSRTSLSSLQSSPPQNSEVYLSDKAKNELRDYASSFDHVRDWKRRMTVV